jgi:hypothetical protein
VQSNLATAWPSVSLAENSPKSQKPTLIHAIANGVSISKWARENKVPNRTAFRWASDPEVRAKAENARRRAVDRAIGKMSRSVNWAAMGIKKLADSAASEPVRLAALRTIFTNMMAVTEFANLKDRMTQLEEQLNERECAGHTGQAG